MRRRRTTVPRRALAFVLLTLSLLLSACAGGSPAAPAPGFTNPVIAGQQPDPTIIRDGDTFYLSTTSRAWAPAFPLMRSRDLVNWEQIGDVMRQLPAWAAGPFWAPEFVPWGGETRVYYTARKRSARSRACIGIARAMTPAGPYQDTGRPLICPPDGAIDAVVTRDEHDEPYLVYRRFHGSGGIWARRLTGDGLRVQGPEHLLLPLTHADEGVVEGPSVVRRDDGFVLLFAAGNCCRPPCDYREAAARSRTLLGPYVRDPRLVLQGSDRLRCPGHGSFVDDGRGGEWFVHHAVLADDPVNARRNTLIEPVRWGDDGWPLIGDGGRPVESGPAPLGVAQRPVPLAPDLRAPRLDPGWEWPWDLTARARQRDGAITLGGDPRGATISRQVAPLDVREQVRVRPSGCTAGIAGLTGDEDAGDAYGIELSPGGDSVRVWQGPAADGVGSTLVTLPLGRRVAELAVDVRGARTLRFSARARGGSWRTLPVSARTGPNRRILRMALTCRGPRTSSASFDALRVTQR